MNSCPKCGADMGFATSCPGCGYIAQEQVNNSADEQTQPFSNPYEASSPPPYAYSAPPPPQYPYQAPPPQYPYQAPPPQYSYQEYVPYPRTQNESLFTAAFVFMCIGTGALALMTFGIALAWGIPMTIHAYRIWKGFKPNTVAFGVCSLLFVGLVAGILLLVAEKDE